MCNKQLELQKQLSDFCHAMQPQTRKRLLQLDASTLELKSNRQQIFEQQRRAGENHEWFGLQA